jgi:hypothetical protein
MLKSYDFRQREFGFSVLHITEFTVSKIWALGTRLELGRELGCNEFYHFWALAFSDYSTPPPLLIVTFSSDFTNGIPIWGWYCNPDLRF